MHRILPRRHAVDAPVVAASVLLRALSLCVLLCLLGTAVLYLLGQLDETVSRHRRDMNAVAYRTQLYFDQREALLNYLIDSVVHAQPAEGESPYPTQGDLRRLPLGVDAGGKALQLLLPARAEHTLQALDVHLFHAGTGTSSRWLPTVVPAGIAGVDASVLHEHALHDATCQRPHWMATTQLPAQLLLYRAIDESNMPLHWLGLALDHDAITAAVSCDVASSCQLVAADGGSILPMTVGRRAHTWPHGADGDTFQFDWRHGLSLVKTIGQDDWHLVQQVPSGLLVRELAARLLGTLLLCTLAALALRSLTLRLERQIIDPARDQHRQLLESFHFGSTVVEMAPVGICVLRCHDGQIMLENQLARDWLGTDPQGSDWHAAWRDIAPSVPSSATTRQTRDFTTHDGRTLQVLHATTRYHDEDVLLCVFNDISRHRQIQAALANAKQAADNASKAKSTFVATMSHEIRTPLHGLLGTLELLARTRLDERQARLLETLQQSSSVLLQLISNVLDVSRIESGQLSIRPAPFCPLELSEACLRAYADAALHKQLQIVVCTDPALPSRVSGDAERIRQILGNLISNAIKFTDSGRIVLRVWPEPDAIDGHRVCWQVTDTGIGIPTHAQALLFKPFQQLEGPHRADGSGLGLSISLHLVEQMQGELQLVSAPGLGSSFTVSLPLPVAEEVDDAPRLSPEPPVYVRCPVAELTDSACRWLQRWGATARPWPAPTQVTEPGAILVDSDPGGAAPLPWSGPRVITTPDAGEHPIAHPARPDERVVSLFSIRAIARGVAELQQGRMTTPSALRPEGRSALGLHVLIVEDNPINSQLLDEQLRMLGCTTTLAIDGEQALECCRSSDFDLVLTDINMPKIDGYTLARRLRAQSATLPIIGATANVAPEISERCRDAGMDDCLFKPIRLASLHACLIARGLRVCPPAPADHASPTHADTLNVPTSVLPVFLDTMRADIDRIDAALAGGQRPQLAQLLHRLHGALVVVSANSLAEAARVAEQTVNGDLPWTQAIATTRHFLFRLDGAMGRLRTAPPAQAQHVPAPEARPEDAHVRQSRDC